MTNNDNSVNIKSRKRAYHHGDLRAELVRIGLDHLARRPVEALSLREIAREAGVSATAVYRHFPDKQALISALCREGGERMGAAQAAAQAAAGGGRGGFDAVGRAYVRFALANPSLFRLMMTSPQTGNELDGAEGKISSGMQLLRDNVARFAVEGASDADRRVKAVQAWALVHGLAMLMLDGQVPVDDSLIEAAI